MYLINWITVVERFTKQDDIKLFIRFEGENVIFQELDIRPSRLLQGLFDIIARINSSNVDFFL